MAINSERIKYEYDGEPYEALLSDERRQAHLALAVEQIVQADAEAWAGAASQRYAKAPTT
jgi:hypothetical protein